MDITFFLVARQNDKELLNGPEYHRKDTRGNARMYSERYPPPDWGKLVPPVPLASLPVGRCIQQLLKSKGL